MFLKKDKNDKPKSEEQKPDENIEPMSYEDHGRNPKLPPNQIQTQSSRKNILRRRGR